MSLLVTPFPLMCILIEIYFHTLHSAYISTLQTPANYAYLRTWNFNVFIYVRPKLTVLSVLS